MDSDTEIGGPNGRFPETRASVIGGTRSPDTAHRTFCYETIVGGYWKPVYRYIRLKWNKSNEDAKDLTQGFFTQAIDKNFFAGYEADKAAFRTYLRTCLDRYLATRHQHENRLKRSCATVPLDEEIAGHPAEEAFERECRLAIFSRALEKLQTQLAAKGKQVYFDVFERYDLAEERPSYEDVARSLNLTAINVTNYLASVRREFRALVLEEVRGMAVDDRGYRRERLKFLGPPC